MFSGLKGASWPAKIMTGLVVCVLLGLGLCGVAGAVHNDSVTGYLFATGAVFFWVGLLVLIVFVAGWVIFAIGKSLFGKKD
jgi:hypothetical protein